MNYFISSSSSELCPAQEYSDSPGKAKVAGVFLHYRVGAATRAGAPYRAVNMLDDGKHGDGATGDGVFGADTATVKPRTKVVFYVEAFAAAAGDA